MKAIIIAASFSITSLAFGAETTDPISYFSELGEPPNELLVRYQQVGFKEIEIDINGDQKTDILLCFDDPDSDEPFEKDAKERNGNALYWGVFVRNQTDTSYVVNSGIAMPSEGITTRGVGIALNPDEIYIGHIDELNRFGIVTIRQASPRVGPEVFTILAYTWEGDHLEQHQLAEYEAAQNLDELPPMPLYDKYLAKGKRTQVQVQQVYPQP